MHNKSRSCNHELAGNPLLIREKKATQQKVLNEHEMGFVTFVIYTNGGSTEEREAKRKQPKKTVL